MSEAWKTDEHWKVINSGGVQVSSTPEGLWEQAKVYFQWVDDNPITAKRTLTSGKTQGEKVTVEYKRPYTIKGFCLHCGISERYLKDITESYASDSLYYQVVEKIMYVIATNLLEGAVVDLYNPIMVSKLLNMDKGASDGETAVNPKVEITNAKSNELSESESHVLANLDFGKVEILKDKLQNPEKKNL